MVHVISFRRRDTVKTSCVPELSKLLWGEGFKLVKRVIIFYVERNCLSKEITKVGDVQTSSESTW